MRISFIKKVLGVLTIIICFNTILYAQVQDNNPIVKSDIVKFINGKSYYIHTVQKGHTLYSISKVYEIPVEDIVFENPGSRENIKLGQTLKIPVTSRESQISRSITKKNFDFFFHVATKNETFKDISKIYMISVENLKYANQDIHLPLREGEYVKIPVSLQNDEIISNPKTPSDIFQTKTIKPKKEIKKEPKKEIVTKPATKITNYKKPTNQADLKYFNHVVKAKETLYSISQKYTISIFALKAANPNLSTAISVGQILKIPTGTTLQKPKTNNTTTKENKNINNNKYGSKSKSKKHNRRERLE